MSSDSNALMDLVYDHFTSNSVGCTVSSSFKFSVEVQTSKGSLTASDQIYVVDYAVFRDYEDNFADVIELSLSFPMGTFMYDVYDDLENLEITVKRKTQFYKDAGSKQEVARHPHIERYKAIFLVDKNAALPTTRSVAKSDMNQQIPIVVVFQLIEKSAEAIRIKTTGGSFSDKNNGVGAEQFMRTVLSTEVGKITVDGNPAVDAFRITPFDSAETTKQIVIPTGTRVVELADYLQEHLGGLYNDGVSLYSQRVCSAYGEFKSVLSMFNLYNPDKEGPAPSIVYSVTSSARCAHYPGAVLNPTGDGVYMLCHKVSGIEDDKTTDSLNKGTGFRATDSSQLLDAPVEYKENGAVFNRNKTATEIVGSDRDDGANFATYKGITHNNLKLSTQVYKSSAKYVTLQVSNLDHTLIYPGMKYEIHYTSNEVQEDGSYKQKIVRRNAYVLQALSAYTTNNPDPIANANSAEVELTNHTTLKMVVGEIIDNSN